MPRAIRPFTDADWPAVWPIVEDVCREGETYAYPVDIDEATARAYWIESPPGRTVVLEDDGTILGTAKMGPNRPGHGDHVGTASFMISGAARGRGAGRALGEHVIAWHREQGFRGIQFNAVVESNTVAVRLWQSLGFTIIGTVPEAFRSPAHGLVGLHVMYQRLA
ncbi:GNAT family N-acetyltransferase [Myceligenerans crystallogenes]|uniref:GNAT family N-acetyltransferase n=1 Tax=Myceligenerans crystallogenes TaxID=316335 RepID=A0ABN2N744_9MICO